MNAASAPSPSAGSRMALEEWFDRYQYSVTSNIGESAVTSISLEDINLSLEDVAKLPLRYGHHQGLPELREAVAADYPNLTADDVLITAGASEAIVLVATALLTERSRVVVEHPTYPTLYLVPQSLNTEVDYLPLRPEQQWQPDWDELRSLLAPGAEFLSLTHPNNPTGSMISVEELNLAVDLCRSAGVRLVSDETYRRMTMGDALPPAATLDPSAVSISTMSKVYGLPGIRIGWIACRDRDLMRRLLACREHITITNNILGEQIALHVQRDPSSFLARAHERISKNRATVEDAVAQHPRLDWIPPSAGVVALPWVTNATDTELTQLYENLAQRRRTFVVPGYGFGLPQAYFRVGFGVEPTQLREGLAALTAELDALNNH